MGRTEGKNGSFIAIRMRIHQNLSSSMTPMGLEAMPKYLIVMWYICSVTVVRDPRPGHSVSDQLMGVAVISQNYIKVT